VIPRALLFWCFMAVAMIVNGIVRETLMRPRMSALILIASIWLFLTLAFEFTFGHWVDHKSWAELCANYNIARGHLWPFVLASLVCAPFVWGAQLHE
jgi:hypothetical protein